MNNDNYELPPVGVKSPPDLDDPVAAWIKNDKYPDGHLVYLPPSVLKKIKIVRYDFEIIQIYLESVVDIDDPNIKTVYFLSQNAYEGDPVGILSLQSLSLVIGQYKARKGFLSVLLAAMLLSKEPLNNTFAVTIPMGKDEEGKCTIARDKILIIDTEQNKADVALTSKRIRNLSGCKKEQILTRFTRNNSIEEKIMILETSLQGRADIIMVFVDGTADLVTGVNEEDQARALLKTLLTMSSKYDIHIQGYIHSNKGLENSTATGKLGGEWMKKGSATFFIKKKGDISTVAPDEAGNRKKDWRPFTIGVTIDAHHVEENELPFIIEGAKAEPVKEPKPYKGKDPFRYPPETHEKLILDQIFKDANTLPASVENGWKQSLIFQLGSLGLKNKDGIVSEANYKMWSAYYVKRGMVIIEGATKKAAYSRATIGASTPSPIPEPTIQPEQLELL